MIKAFVEGLGSKTLAFILAGIASALVAPVLFSKFGVPVELTFDVLCGIGTAVLLGIFKQWHIDATSGGTTTTAYRLTQQVLQGAERILPDGTTMDTIVKSVIEAMQKAQAKEPPAPEPAPSGTPAT